MDVPRMKRLQIGLIALVLLISAASLYMMGAVANAMAGTVGGLLRVGLVMGALWLAMPQLSAFFTKTPKWLLIALVAAVVVFALQPKLLWWIPVAMLGIWFLYTRFGFGAQPASGPPRVPRRPKRKA
jgi:hypothetical protein